MAARSFRVGLTGGIGSGKSLVTAQFAALGVPVIDADQIARELTEPDTAAYEEIVTGFGRGVLDEHGRIDRRRLRAAVFDHATDRERLEAILHPRIRAEMERRAQTVDAPYCVLVIPLLAETGQADMVDRVLVVDADDERRLRWLTARDDSSEVQIRKIMAAQASREDRLAIADDCIQNDQDIAHLATEVQRLHAQYLRLAAQDD